VLATTGSVFDGGRRLSGRRHTVVFAPEVPKKEKEKRRVSAAAGGGRVSIVTKENGTEKVDGRRRSSRVSGAVDDVGKVKKKRGRPKKSTGVAAKEKEKEKEKEVSYEFSDEE
jgi:hypothetical protein